VMSLPGVRKWIPPRKRWVPRWLEWVEKGTRHGVPIAHLP
jgi:hypothetical protein